MPLPHPAICFASGIGVGALTWLLLVPEPQPGAVDKPSRFPASPVAAEATVTFHLDPGPAGPPRSATTPSTSITEDADAEPRLHLWEALALRGTPKGNLAKWILAPGLTNPTPFKKANAGTPLNPEFVAFFDLTHEEKVGVQSLLHDTLRQQRKMDQAHALVVEPSTEMDFAVELPDYSAEAGPLRQSYEGRLRALLGEARYQVYREWGVQSFQADFPGLAGTTRRYQFGPSKRSDAPLMIIATSNPAANKSLTWVKDLTEAERLTQLPLSRLFGNQLPSNAPRLEDNAQ